MSRWGTRVSEEANLLSPPFCALLTWHAASGYVEKREQGMPLPLCYVAVPLLLHKSSRTALPRDIRTSFAAWLDETPAIRVGLVDRCRALVPYVREAITFGLAKRAFSLVDEARLIPGAKSKALGRYTSTSTEEVKECLRRSQFLGRWFASAGSPATVFALLGIRP